MPAAGPGASLALPRAAETHELVIVSDVICPWCYVGQKQLEQAFAATGLASRFKVIWQPYELNPTMPPEGVDRRVYRTRKFGSLEHSQMLDARVAAAGRRAGIEFRHDLMLRTPNTIKAHRLVWLAGQEGVQDAVVDALFRAYFIEGRDVGETAVLTEVAVATGMDQSRVAGFLDSDAGADEVRREAQSALRAGIAGVPTFILDGEPVFSGAVGAEVIAAHLGDVAKTNPR
ncbi:MAG: DsbA family oxidoreductase [Betaproteobacteria bacterium]